MASERCGIEAYAFGIADLHRAVQLGCGDREEIRLPSSRIDLGCLAFEAAPAWPEIGPLATRI